MLGSFAPALTDKATRILQQLGVELNLGVHVTDVRSDGITVTPKSGGPEQVHRTHTVLWTAGVEAVPFARKVAAALSAQTDKAGRIAVEADLTVPGHPEVFVIGDLVGRDHLPGVAENAMQGGLHVASCIRRDATGAPRRPYRYRDLGSAAYISYGHALLQAGPVKLSGRLGWLAWGFIHIAFLTGVQNRISTVASAEDDDRAGSPHRPYVHPGQHHLAGTPLQLVEVRASQHDSPCENGGHQLTSHREPGGSWWPRRRCWISRSGRTPR